MVDMVKTLTFLLTIYSKSHHQVLTCIPGEGGGVRHIEQQTKPKQAKTLLLIQTGELVHYTEFTNILPNLSSQMWQTERGWNLTTKLWIYDTKSQKYENSPKNPYSVESSHVL